MRRARFTPEYAAGVLIRDSQGKILAVSRQRTNKRHVGEHARLDWGLPGGYAQKGEGPADTAARELLEETGLSIGPLGYLLTVPPQHTRTQKPYHVFIPLTGWYGNLYPATKEGATAWVDPGVLLNVRNPSLSVAQSNRFILYWALGIV